MKKCFNCGKEFEGKFCPECGTKWEEKICPNCGTKLNDLVKYCNECGCFLGDNQVKPQKSKNNLENKTSNLNIGLIYSILRYVPVILSGIFSLLIFAFYAAPVAEVIMGEGLPNISLGNVYQMYSGLLSEIPEIEWAMITLVIVAIVTIIFALISSITVFSTKIRNKEIRFGKNVQPIFIFLEYMSFIFYAIFLAFGIIIICEISSIDEGMGIFKAGSCPILLIVFSLLFALLSISSFIVRHFLAKKYPELVKNEANKIILYRENEKARRDKFYETHQEPIMPTSVKSEKDNKKQLIIYKYEKRQYDKATEKKTPSFVIWIALHKTFCMLITILAIFIITAGCFAISYFNNKFKISVVEKIEPGYTSSEVKKILGSPYEDFSSETVWKYYSNSYSSILKKIKKNNLDQEKALVNGNDDAYLKLAGEEEKLMEELAKVSYSYIEITFAKDDEEYTVSSIYFEKTKSDNSEEENKMVKDIKLSNDTEFLGYYVVNSAGIKLNYLMNFNCDFQLYYSAYYSDGSFYRTLFPRVNSLINGKYAEANWEDRFASYHIRETAIGIGEIDENGAWSTTYHGIESIIIPADAKELNTDAFKDCDKLRKVILSNNLARIGDYAFCNCSQLDSITIPSKVSSIGKYAFYNCDKLSTVTMSSNIIEIEEKAFTECNNLNKIYYLGSAEQWNNMRIDSGNELLVNAKRFYQN